MTSDKIPCASDFEGHTVRTFSEDTTSNSKVPIYSLYLPNTLFKHGLCSIYRRNIIM